jgi:hypothetical protein
MRVRLFSTTGWSAFRLVGSRGSGKLGLTRTLMKKVISRSVKIAPQTSNTLLVRRHRRRRSS